MKNVELSKHHMLIVMGCLGIINIVIRYNDYLGYGDIRWFLLIAQKFIEGGHYGKDFYEFNTPFSFLIYLPALLLSKIFLSDPLGWISLFYSTFVLFCLHKTLFNCQKNNIIQNPKEKNILLFILFILFVIFPDSTVFAQRDVIVFLACLPYLTQRINSPSSAHSYLFLLALFSIWIKPYVAIALIVIWIISNIYYKIPIRKKEVFLLSLTILSYCIFIQLFFEEWWHIIYVTSQSYYAYNASWDQLFFKYLPLACLLMLAIVINKKYLPFIIIAAVFGVNALLQKKPFSYYSFGAEAFTIGILLFILIKKWHQSFQFLFCIVISFILLFLQVHLKQKDILAFNQKYCKIENIFNQYLKTKDSVFIFSLNMDTYQVLFKNHITTASRYLFMWPLKPFLEKNSFSSIYIKNQLSELSLNIKEDIKEKKPTIIMIPYFFVNHNYANWIYHHSLNIYCLNTINIEKCENFYRLISTMNLMNLTSIISADYTLKYTIDYPDKTNIMAIYIKN